jgi:hypothetical protein
VSWPAAEDGLPSTQPVNGEVSYDECFSSGKPAARQAGCRVVAT